MPLFANISTSTEYNDAQRTAFDNEVVVASSQKDVISQFATYKAVPGAAAIKCVAFGAMTVNTTPIVEGEDIVAQKHADTSILITPQVRGDAVITTKIAEMGSGGLISLAAAKAVGENIGANYNKVATLKLATSTASFTPSGAAEASITVSNDSISRKFFAKMYGELESRNVPTFSNGLYVAVVHPKVMAAIRADASTGSAFDSVKFTSTSLARTMDVVEYMGFMLISNQQNPSVAGAVNRYDNYFFGANGIALGESMAPQVVIKDTNGIADLQVSYAWKAAFDFALFDTTKVLRGVCASEF